MSESPQQAEPLICLGCGESNDAKKHFCTACGAPLTAHATMDPFASIFAEGYAAHQALNRPVKPIVVIGVWCWMLPLGLIALFAMGYSAYEVIRGDVLIWEALFISLPAAVIAWIAWTFLSRISRRGWQARAGNANDPKGEGAETPEREAEASTCLQCGQPLVATATACSACGWTWQ